ncbi:expressed unknown protein [Seminavis robusta]|uniref:Uncharacterized protein n=1 Tax=Seminavis robusta TaxID=568900 RepID=A0A9N8HBQ2_9STRA|nr:expressed unknown protein [Seminavis robusta]|eukprot:Sro347_g123080.1 n/a (122) ;mRNA; f:68828-69193
MASHDISSNNNGNNNNQYATPPTRASQTAVSNSVMMAVMRDSGNSSTTLMNQLEARMGQIFDDADHRRCSEGNQRALLAEKLENLRQLTKELEKDEWMYAEQKTNSGLTLTRMPAAKQYPF